MDFQPIRVQCPDRAPQPLFPVKISSRFDPRLAGRGLRLVGKVEAEGEEAVLWAH